ncbi:NusG domain II-containing protein [Enterococcus cecorum]|nr:NusG domain II-containing protein [Enterococcus cecorum]
MYHLMRMKFGDLILIVLFLLASFLPLVFFHVQQSNENNVVTTKYAIVKIKGKEVERFDLTKKQHIIKTYYPNKKQYNIIEIYHGRIRVKEDNSPDQIAVRTGWIDTVGQTSICLPHQLIITIEQEGIDNYHIY